MTCSAGQVAQAGCHIRLDIDMPVMTGLDVRARLRAGNEKVGHEGMIALLVTASPTAQNVRATIKARADGVIAKPVDQARIASEIARAMARQSAKR